MGAIALHWRQIRYHIKHGLFFAESGLKQPLDRIKNNLEWDDFEIVPKLAHENGMKANLYVSLFCCVPAKAVLKKTKNNKPRTNIPKSFFMSL